MKAYQELVREARSGRRGAFDELMSRFRPMALSVAGRHLQDPSLTEDVVQEAFLTVYVKLDQLKNPTAFPSWLKTIVYSACRNMCKRNVVEVPLDGAALRGENLPRVEGPEELCVRWQTREMVARTLDALPGAAREACRMRYVLGLPYRHIAEVLGIPVGTVKRRLHDARERIIREVRGREPDVIRVGYLPISDHLLAMVSHARGGGRCRVALRKFLSWDALERALCDGTVDAAYAMVPLAMHLSSRGVDLSYVLNGHHEGSAVVGRSAMADRRDLAGVRLGLPHEFSTHRMMLHELVRQTGGAVDDAGGRGTAISYAGPSFVNGMFRRGALDAFFCAEPWSSLCESLHGGTVLIRSGEVAPGHACCGIVVRNEFAGKHGEVVREYLRMVRSAAGNVGRRPEDAASVQARYTGVPRAVAEHVLRSGHVTFGGLSPDRESLERSMVLAARAGMLDAPCNLDAFVSGEYL